MSKDGGPLARSAGQLTFLCQAVHRYLKSSVKSISTDLPIPPSTCWNMDCCTPTEHSWRLKKWYCEGTWECLWDFKLYLFFSHRFFPPLTGIKKRKAVKPLVFFLSLQWHQHKTKDLSTIGTPPRLSLTLHSRLSTHTHLWPLCKGRRDTNLRKISFVGSRGWHQRALSTTKRSFFKRVHSRISPYWSTFVFKTW